VTTGQPQQPQMLCRLGASTCKELHPLKKCEQFKKLSPEQRAVKVNELQLCLNCLKHPANRECYAKGKADFKGCSEDGCSMELHWTLLMARLFQVQVRQSRTLPAPRSYSCDRESNWARWRSASPSMVAAATRWSSGSTVHHEEEVKEGWR
jgi:hypothetical protein